MLARVLLLSSFLVSMLACCTRPSKLLKRQWFLSATKQGVGLLVCTRAYVCARKILHPWLWTGTICFNVHHRTAACVLCKSSFRKSLEWFVLWEFIVASCIYTTQRLLFRGPPANNYTSQCSWGEGVCVLPSEQTSHSAWRQYVPLEFAYVCAFRCGMASVLLLGRWYLSRSYLRTIQCVRT